MCEFCRKSPCIIDEFNFCFVVVHLSQIEKYIPGYRFLLFKKPKNKPLFNYKVKFPDLKWIEIIWGDYCLQLNWTMIHSSHQFIVMFKVFITIFSVDRNQNAMQSGMPKRPPTTPYFAQHDELIRYIHGQWQKVSVRIRTYSIIRNELWKFLNVFPSLNK